MIRIQTEDFDVAALNAELRTTAGGKAGAMVTFTGYVRDQADGTATESLFLEHYPGMCEREIEAVCDQARQRWPILDTLVVHRVGELHLTEQIVYVGVTSAHRGDAFRACEFIMDVLKTRAPFWKRENLADGKRFWVQQRDSDAQKTDAWNTSADTNKHV